MSTATVEMPRQRVSVSEKTDDWYKSSMNAIIAMSEFEQPTTTTWKDDIRKAYDFYNGIIDESDYTHVLNPYGKRRKNFPAKLHNYPILKPVIDLLLGEKRRRPFAYSVVVANSDITNRRDEALSAVMRENLEQLFINELGGQGIETGLEEEETAIPEKVQEDFLASYRDARAVAGQQAMNFLIHHQEIRPKFSKGWKHWLISGITVTLRDVVGDEVIYEILNPLHVDYDKSDDTDFIEDGEWATIRQMAVRSKIVDAYYKYLTAEQIDKLEHPRTADSDYLDYGYADKGEKSPRAAVIRVYWKCQKKVGIVTYIDEDGELQQKEVSEGYQVDEDEAVDWDWVNEVQQGVRIDEDIFIKLEPYPVQRTSMDNASKCKLPINGRKYSDLNSPNISLLMLGVPYQLSYNIYKYRLENAIAKSKDIIAMLDINMIPKKFDMDKFMYFLDATGIAWVDYAKEGIKFNPQHQSVVDLSIKTIGDFIELLDSIKSEWYELAGVSRQRLGEIQQYDGRDVTQQAIVQSAMITEELFSSYSELEQRDLQALIDLSRYAWINGKKGTYVTSDQSQEILNIDGIEHMDSEYGIFVTDSAEEREKLDVLRGLVQAFVQNGAPMSSIIDMVESTNFVALKGKILKAEQSLNELQQAQVEAENQELEYERQLKLTELEHGDTNKELDRRNKIDVAIIQADAQLKDPFVDRDRDGIPDSAEILARDREQLRELSYKRDELKVKREIEEKKIKLGEKKIETDAAVKREVARKKGPSK